MLLPVQAPSEYYTVCPDTPGSGGGDGDDLIRAMFTVYCLIVLVVGAGRGTRRGAVVFAPLPETLRGK